MYLVDFFDLACLDFTQFFESVGFKPLAKFGEFSATVYLSPFYSWGRTVVSPRFTFRLSASFPLFGRFPLLRHSGHRLCPLSSALGRIFLAFHFGYCHL